MGSFGTSKGFLVDRIASTVARIVRCPLGCLKVEFSTIAQQTSGELECIRVH